MLSLPEPQHENTLSVILREEKDVWPQPHNPSTTKFDLSLSALSFLLGNGTGTLALELCYTVYIFS